MKPKSGDPSQKVKTNMTISTSIRHLRSIATHISNLEKDNTALRKRVKDLEESRDSLLQHIQDENTKLWDEYLAEDDESVASNTDESESESESSTMAQITGDEPYESDSDATTVGKPDCYDEDFGVARRRGAETEETESESESESDSDSDYFVCYNHDLTAFLDDLADREENKYKKYAFRHAANMVYNYPSKVKCGEQIAHISGIGQGIIRRIDEYLETGTLTTDSESEYESESESDLLSPLKGKN